MLLLCCKYCDDKSYCRHRIIRILLLTINNNSNNNENNNCKIPGQLEYNDFLGLHLQKGEGTPLFPLISEKMKKK